MPPTSSSLYAGLLAVVAAGVPANAIAQQQQLIHDDFESGSFGAGWTHIEGANVFVASGSGAGGSSRYARVEGVGSADAGLARTFSNLAVNSPAASDFVIQLAFRLDAPQSGERRFNLILSSASASPSTSPATVNLRYQHPNWQAYDGGWQTLTGLSSVVDGQWHQLMLTGNNWGSGVAGAADYDIVVIDSGGTTSSQFGIQLYQSAEPSSTGLQWMSLQDFWGSNSGFDVDDVSVLATPLSPGAATTTVTPVAPVAYSGIFPHLAVSNGANECGMGALLSRNDGLWFVTYPPHVTTGSVDNLYRVSPSDLSITTYSLYPGNTDANRYSSTALGLDFVGAAYIDAAGTVGFLPVSGSSELRGRLTGMAPGRTATTIQYATMEEGLYEVDFGVSPPAINKLREDGNHGGPRDIPGVHGKGYYAGQGHFYYTNNGGNSAGAGALAEWDGVADPSTASGWTIVDDTAQYTEVTGPQGPVDVSVASNDAIWAVGWDDKGVLLRVRDESNGQWARYRLLRASATHGHPNGWYTEWPRIRDAGLANNRLLLNHHGTFFSMPADFDVGNAGAIMPISSFLKMVVDYAPNGSDIVFACNDGSRFSNYGVRAEAELEPAVRAAGGVRRLRRAAARRRRAVSRRERRRTARSSDPLSIAGYPERIVFFDTSSGTASFRLEVADLADGPYTSLQTVAVPSSGTHYLIPDTVTASWLRVVAVGPANGARVIVRGRAGETPKRPELVASLARPGTARISGLIRSTADSDYRLQYAADHLDAQGNVTGTGFYVARLNATTQQVELVATSDPAAEADLRSSIATGSEYTVDSASVLFIDNGTRYRLPKVDPAFDSDEGNGPRRARREVVTERSLLQAHGTIYELPRNFNGGRFRQIRPVTSHGLEIHDFGTWRGMLVLAGADAAASADEHFVRSDDGQVGLWFGNVDDLWAFGAPRGVGGPWNQTPVTAGSASDQYLMFGYRRKLLSMSHDQGGNVTFTVEVDAFGDDNWQTYATFSVPPGGLTHEFAIGFDAHWVRLRASQSCTATAWFEYGSWGEWDPVFGAGCAGAVGVPGWSLAGDGVPRIARPLELELDNVPPSPLPPFMTVGTIGLPGGFPIFPGCSVYTDAPALAAMVPGSPNTASISIPVPSTAGLIGIDVYVQALAFDATTFNGLVLSDCGRARFAR